MRSSPALSPSSTTRRPDMQQYLLLFAAMAAIFYLLILRPQQRAKRKKAETNAALREGAQVLTVGGIYGTIAEVRDDDFDLEIAEGVVMRMDRRAIAAVISDTDEDDAEVEEDDAAEVDGDEQAGGDAATQAD